MIELNKDFSGTISGMPFEHVRILLEGISEKPEGKEFLFAVEPLWVNLLSGGHASRFSHYLDNSISNEVYGDMGDIDIANELIKILSS